MREQKIFTDETVAQVQQHVAALLQPLVEAGKDLPEWGKRALPAAFKASYRKENRGMLVIIMVHVSSFFEQGRVAMDEIYGDDSLSKEEKKRRASILPYWQQRVPGAFSGVTRSQGEAVCNDRVHSNRCGEDDKGQASLHECRYKEWVLAFRHAQTVWR